MRPVLRVGLTGGIASGKTTVARMLSDLGAFVADADRIAHELLAPGGRAVDAVVGHFGREILDARDGIDRSALARRVFADPAARAALNGIIHPEVRRELDLRIESFRRDKAGGPVAVVDAALLVETGRHRTFDRLVVVRCGRDTQLERILERDGVNRDEAEARIEAQAPLEKKLAVADYIIDTETSLGETRRRAEDVYAALLEDFRQIYQPAAP
jgi:dephospho-CoA kinase